MLGKVIEVCCDAEGTALSRCIHIRAYVDIHKPLLCWTNINIGGFSCKIMFRYEKMADFCYMCGRLDHLERNCTHLHSDGLRYCGPWLRANGQNPTSLEDVASELNRLNSRKLTPPPSHSRRTPASRDPFTPVCLLPLNTNLKATTHSTTPIPFTGLHSNSSTPNNIGACSHRTITPPLGFSKLAWKILIIK